MRTTTRSIAAASLAAPLTLLLAFAANAATLLVESNGGDDPGCGVASQPCRSIGAAVRNAATGDRIVVGPGRYGDVNTNGAVDPGDESSDPSCHCLIQIDKSVEIVSRFGAAATIIDGNGADVFLVRIDADGVVFGRAGKGFTLTGGSSGLLVADKRGATVAGNHALRNRFGGFELAGRQSRVTRNLATANGNWGFDVYGEWLVSNNVSVQSTIGFSIVGDHHVITGNLASGNTMAGFSLAFGPHVFRENSAIANIGAGVWVQDSMPVNKNNIYGNDPTTNCGVWNISNATVDASGNYWGAAAGPGANPADGVCNEGTSQTATPTVAAHELRMNVISQR